MTTAEHRLVFESFGVTAEVATADRAIFDALPQVLPPDLQSADGEPVARFALRADGTVVRDGEEVAHVDPDGDAALIKLGSVVRHHLALHAPDHVFIHAGVVSAGGGAIVIPGGSHSGKSTLVDELVRAGATYHSDEYAPVDAEGLIHPYPKPLSLRPPDGDGLGVLHPVPEEQIGREPVRIGLVVVTNYEAGAEWEPVERTGGEGALVLLRNAVAARPRPQDSLAVVGRLARDARVISSARGEAHEVAASLVEMANPSSPIEPSV